MNPFIAYSLQTLVPLLSSPGRYYHNMEHVNFCLGQLEFWRQDQTKQDRPSSLTEVEHAIWFHDAIYNPFMPPGKNEKDSALLYKVLINSFRKRETDNFVGVHQGIVYRCIERTAKHREYSGNLYALDSEWCEESLMADIDLVSLGLPWEEFKHNNDNVRLEYSRGVSGMYEKVRKGNTDFLVSMLARPNLYYLKWFRGKYEEQARANIKRLEQEGQPI